MRTISRDGLFEMSISDFDLTKKEIDTYFNAVDGKNPTLSDLADAIAYDCFNKDCLFCLCGYGKTLRCHVTVGRNKYEFKIEEYNNNDMYLIDIACQLKL